MNRVRTALVGCGKVGQIHAQALASLAESEFVAVCDVDAERASAFAAQYGVRPFADVGAMLALSSVAGRRRSARRTRCTPGRRSWPPRPAFTSWSRSRWPPAWPTATPCSRRPGRTGSSWASSASGAGTSRSGA